MEVTGEGWPSTSLIRNVSARLRSSNHMLPTDFCKSRTHPRATYRRILPRLLLLSANTYRAGTGRAKRGLRVSAPARAVYGPGIYRNSNKIHARECVTSRHDNGIRYRKRVEIQARRENSDLFYIFSKNGNENFHGKRGIFFFFLNLRYTSSPHRNFCFRIKNISELS